MVCEADTDIRRLGEHLSIAPSLRCKSCVVKSVFYDLSYVLNSGEKFDTEFDILHS